MIYSSSINIEKYALTKSAQDLEEVIVTATLPQYKLENGNLITNVENTLLSTIGSANDLMNQIPGVSLGENNSINVFGKGTPIVYINNRKIYDSNELNLLQSSDIVSVKVLRNPGAKYDAQSQSVIIIKTKKKASGLSANILSRTWFKKHIETSNGLDITYSIGKLNTFFSYNYAHWKEGIDSKAEHYIYSDTIWLQSSNIPSVYQNNVHNVSIGADYSITERQNLGFEYRNTFSKAQDKSIGHGDFYINDIIDENIISKTFKRNKVNNHLLNLFYDNTLSDKFNIRLDIDYINKRSPSQQLILEKSTIPTNNSSITIQSKANFNLFASKLTGVYSIGETSHVELGSEYNYIQGDGFYKNNGNLSYSNNIYENNENKVAFFIGYTTIINGWEMGLGLRYEHSHEKTTEDSIKTVKTNRYYNDLYPNITISKKINNVSIGLNGNVRTRRPSFSQLNSNDIYVNRFLSQRGNPYLKKEDYYEISSSILYKMISINIGYSYVKDPISFNMLQNGLSEANSRLTFTNYNKSQQISFLASINHKVGWWRPKLTIGVIKPFFSSIYRGEKQNYNRINFSSNFSNDLVLPNNFILSLYFRYQNDYYSYSTKWKGYTMLNAQLRKSLLQNKLKLNLYVNDIFNTRKDRNEIEVGNYNFVVAKKNETQYISFSIQYLFNKSNKQYRGKNVSENDIERL